MILFLSLCNQAIAYPTWSIDQEPSGFNRVYFVRGGTCRYDDGERAFTLKKNCLYVFPSGKRYTLRQDLNDPLDHLYFHCTTHPAYDELVEAEVEENSLLADALALLIKHIGSAKTEKLTGLCELILSSLPERNTPLNEEIDAYRVRDYLDKNLDRPVTLEELSKFAHREKSYLIREFKRKFSVSPLHYHNDRRLEQAVRLLQTGAGVNAVVERLAFSSPSNFRRMFASRYGLTPAEYLAQLDEEKLRLENNRKRFPYRNQ